jgi:3-hydroxyisobutyrate dehydrogenase-like beta-hydroxyacid dehydrogenase
MSKVAFLGLGMMGSEVARRLADANHDVTVWNRTRERSTPLEDEVTGVADHPVDAVQGAEFVVTMLATPQAVDDVLFGEHGIATALEPGQVWVDMSTIGPHEFLGAAGRLPRGVVAVDAPVRGRVPEASEGRLHIFVGAADDVYPNVRELLAPLGDVRHAGPQGAGAATKLVANLALVDAMVAFGEALALAEAMALEQGLVMDVLAESPIGGIVHAKRADVESAHYPASFKLALATKDMTLVESAAHGLGLELPLTSAAREWMEKALSEGAGEFDFSAVAATITGHAATPE